MLNPPTHSLHPSTQSPTDNPSATHPPSQPDTHQPKDRPRIDWSNLPVLIGLIPVLTCPIFLRRCVYPRIDWSNLPVAILALRLSVQLQLGVAPRGIAMMLEVGPPALDAALLDDDADLFGEDLGGPAAGVPAPTEVDEVTLVP